MIANLDIVDTRLDLSDERIDELPYGDASFEVVVANRVVTRSPDAQRVIAEIARVLMPGGKLALCDAVRRGPKGHPGAPPLFGYLHAVAASGLALETCRSYGGPCITLIAEKQSAQDGL